MQKAGFFPGTAVSEGGRKKARGALGPACARGPTIEVPAGGQPAINQAGPWKATKISAPSGRIENRPVHLLNQGSRRGVSLLTYKKDFAKCILEKKVKLLDHLDNLMYHSVKKESGGFAPADR